MLTEAGIGNGTETETVTGTGTENEREDVTRTLTATESGSASATGNAIETESGGASVRALRTTRDPDTLAPGLAPRTTAPTGGTGTGTVRLHHRRGRGIAGILRSGVIG